MVEECKGIYEDIGLKIINDNLNFHNDATLYIIRKDSHYDALYKGGDTFGVANIKELIASDDYFT